MMGRRTLAIMGDGGFWHNGLLTGVQSALFNGDDAVLLILKNGYTSATGTQEIISTPDDETQGARARQAAEPGRPQPRDRDTLNGLGSSGCARSTPTTSTKMRATLDEAFTTRFAGLKVIIAEGECQLERQRRIKPWLAGAAASAASAWCA